ncbi:extracellular solute-binding protein [Caldalkalibacillus salinus]|uniref:extracellular solute-binding protein n=1 Tax=Caldalkalibacillus salinus TaxID=2803787 RepID=UPI0019248EB4|nr:extracellular solute-binding protein [Caldalkalibacillus salinus]
MKSILKTRFGVFTLSVLFLVSTVMSACSPTEETNQSTTESDTDRLEINIMTTAYSPEPPSDDSPALKGIEDYTDTDITMHWVLDNAYEDKLNITMASGELPEIMMIPNKMPSFINAVRNGAFWELGPYLDDYPNLKESNEIVLNNMSIDGKVYGVYRARPLGRLGVTIRKDWLEHLDLDIPKTIDEFYHVLKAFKEQDPNGSGQDDTYGMVVSKYNGPWDIMQTWFGAPNKWGEDPNGQLIPDFTTDEYMEALRFFKKLYDEGLVNEDFAVMDPLEWGDPIVNGEAGVIVDVLDRGHRAQEDIQEINPDIEDPIDVFGAVEGPKGLRHLPTSGYSGMLAIPKTSVQTEEHLRQILTFIDKLNDAEPQIFAQNGVEGRHFEIQDGELVELDNGNNQLVYEKQDLNQFIAFIPENRFHEPEQTPLRVKEQEIMEANEAIVVPNPAEALISEVYSQRGQQLDNIINDARIKFIVGQIDEAGFQDAVDLWYKSGGEAYVNEINEQYQAIQN